MARACHGDFILRIEDIDQSRARPEWEAQIYDDLKWLGLGWDADIRRQSDELESYEAALEQLWGKGILYGCSCNRKDIQAAMSAPQEGVEQPIGPDGIIYPRTCSVKPQPNERPRTMALRLNMDSVVIPANNQFSFEETGAGPNRETGFICFDGEYARSGLGDIVVARRDMGTSYHLSVVLDDAAQDITHVVRGQDLFDATRIHVVLQHFLDLPTPTYHHHQLIRDAEGKRLAKRDDARAIRLFRDEGASPDDIRRMVGL